MNATKNITTCLGFLLVCLMLVSQAAYAGVAGHAQFVNGSVQIVNSAGQTSVLQKGAAVNEGDTLISAKDASAQIKMLDGGFTAMRPDTRLKFDSFVFNGKEDGSERSFFSLLKGGFRSVTGLIGRVNKTNYRITTASSTIGIRGTDHETYVVTADSPLASVAPTGTYNKVNVGETFMTTDKGTIFVLPNQMGFAGAMDQMPLVQPLNTNLFTVAPAPAPQGKGDKKEGEGVRDTAVVDPNQQGSVVAANVPPQVNPFIIPVCATDPATGQCINLTGGSLLTGGGSPTLSTSGFSPGVYPGLYQVTSYSSSSLSVIESSANYGTLGTYTYDATGLTRDDCGSSCFIAIGTAQNVDVGGVAGIISWGRWSNGTIMIHAGTVGLNVGPDQGLHYIVGIPTSLAQMPTTNIAATYNLIGGTSPTPSDGAGGGLGLGHLISGLATVYFNSGQVNGNLVMGFNGASIYQANYNGYFEGGLTLNGTTRLQSGSIDVCGEGCPTQYRGQFYGANASHLGVGYMINTNKSFNINGVAAYAAAAPTGTSATAFHH
jgi:FecR protein